MSLGNRIATLRKKANLSRGQLASLLSVSRQAVSKWENDQGSPDTLNLIRIADVLSCDVEYLATGKDTKKGIEKQVEYKEKIVERVVEVPFFRTEEKVRTEIVEKIVEKPIIRKVLRIKYVRNPLEFLGTGIVCFFFGLLIGHLL